MISSPVFIIFIGSLILAFLALLVFSEVKKNKYRNHHQEMFGTDTFNQKVSDLKLSEREIKILELLVRHSGFFNKDAVLNSPSLFEKAVDNYYAYESLEHISDEVLHMIEELREKLGYNGIDIDFSYLSTRQFTKEHFLKLIDEKLHLSENSLILQKNERNWEVRYTGSIVSPEVLIGQNIKVVLTRQGDAVYSAVVRVQGLHEGNLILSHSSKLRKKQLRRWVRRLVHFPVEVKLSEATVIQGFLDDLSAGGILLVLPVRCEPQSLVHLRFELPGLGEEQVWVRILNTFDRKKEGFPDHFLCSASFEGEFGRVQEDILQYIFEVHKSENRAQKVPKNRSN